MNSASPAAPAGDATAAAATVLIGWNQAGPAALAWALIVGALTAQLVHQGTHRP
ncbi:hypothetical protein [Streptomyces virginiae]|uniref:hypothetical protein n=1 Tax=Streptomyces virginiae TaxID=1961 RepID=UPI0030DE2D7D